MRSTFCLIPTARRDGKRDPLRGAIRGGLRDPFYQKKGKALGGPLRGAIRGGLRVADLMMSLKPPLNAPLKGHP